MSMKDFPPPPWNELFEIFDLSKNPSMSSIYWLHEAKYSCLFKHRPNFKEFSSFLLKLTPYIKQDSNEMKFRPRFSGYFPCLQRLILEFLLKNSNELSSKTCALLQSSVEVHNENIGDTALLDIAKSLSKENFHCSKSQAHQYSAGIALPDKHLSFCNTKVAQPLNSCETLNTKVAQRSNKRAGDVMQSQVLSKKPRVSELTIVNFSSPSRGATPESNDETNIVSDVLRQAFKNEDVDKVVWCFSSHKANDLSDACRSLLSTNCITNETVLSEICARLFENMENKQPLFLYLLHLCVAHVKLLQKGASRHFMQTLSQLAKKDPCTCLEWFLLPLVEQLSRISLSQVTLLSCLLKDLSSHHQLRLFDAALKNIRLPENTFETTICLFRSFLNVKLKLGDDQMFTLCQFFKLYAEKASSYFSFAKLLLFFINIYASSLSDENASLIEIAITLNGSTLKSACKRAFSKVKQLKF